MTEYQYEKLEVWKKAVDFSVQIISTITNKPDILKKPRIAQSLETSSMAIAAAIAEGKAYASGRDFRQHLFAARGAIYKTMTLLEMLKRQKIIAVAQYEDLDASAQHLTAMVSALIKSVSGQKSNPAKAPS